MFEFIEMLSFVTLLEQQALAKEQTCLALARHLLNFSQGDKKGKTSCMSLCQSRFLTVRDQPEKKYEGLCIQHQYMFALLLFLSLKQLVLDLKACLTGPHV